MLGIGRVANFAAAALAIGENFYLLNYIVFHHHAYGDGHLFANFLKNPRALVITLVVANAQSAHWPIHYCSGLGANLWGQPKYFGLGLQWRENLCDKIGPGLINPLGIH